MDYVTVFIAKAMICFAQQCHPALVGPDTIPGEYDMSVLYTQQAGYGGDVLVYDQNETEWYAVHRTYDRDRRRDRSLLYDREAEYRQVTSGCVNVQPEVYENLRERYRNARLLILE